MSWRDEDIDKLFQENAANTSSEYKNAYWKEFEAASLPINKGGKDFMWVGTALVFLGIITTMSVYNLNGNVETNNTATQLASNGQTKNTTNSFGDQVIRTTDGDAVNSRNIISENGEIEEKEEENTSNLNNSKLDDSRVYQSNNYSLNGSAKSNSLATLKRNVDIGEDVLGNPLLTVVIPSGVDDLPSVNNSEDLAYFEINSLSPRSLQNQLAKSQAPEFKFKMPPIELRTATLLYFEVNGGLSESIVSPSNQYSNSFGAGIGVELQKNKLNLTLGVNGIISSHNDIQLNRKSLVYGFGSEVISTQLIYSQIYSIEGNISVGYNFGKHVLSLGIRPSYVVGSKVRDKRVVNDVLVHDIQGYGHIDGLKRFGLKPQIGYAYKFKHGFTLGGNLGVQTQESLNEDFINGQNNRFPLDGQIYFRKSIRLRK